MHRTEHKFDVLQETLKSVIAQYNASQLLTMREVSSPTCIPNMTKILQDTQAA